MKLIIDIPEQMYLNAKADLLCGADIIVSAIKNGIPHETVTEFADKCRECGSRYGKRIKELESNQTKVGHWIPVSERLPEDKTYVLTTIKVPNRQAHARSGWYEGGYFHNDNGDTWKATDREVKAWMPLPEPYKAGKGKE